MTKKDVLDMCEEIRTSDFFKRFALEDSWLSGSSTWIHPIQIWRHTVNIQLATLLANGRSASFRKLFRRLKRKYPTLMACFFRNDGSFPAEYIIRFCDYGEELAA